MKSYSSWMSESNPGNYVSVGVKSLPTRSVSTLPGIITPDPHITLMYSEHSAVPMAHVQYVLSRYPMNGVRVQVTGVDVFDSHDEEGKHPEPVGCIVLKVAAQQLNDIHNHLIRLGCKHSYADFKPHATLIYDCPISQCDITVKEIQQEISRGELFLELTSFKNDVIKKNWASSTK